MSLSTIYEDADDFSIQTKPPRSNGLFNKSNFNDASIVASLRRRPNPKRFSGQSVFSSLSSVSLEDSIQSKPSLLRANGQLQFNKSGFSDAISSLDESKRSEPNFTESNGRMQLANTLRNTVTWRNRTDAKNTCYRTYWEVDMKMKFGRRHSRRICIDIMPPIEVDIKRYEEVRGNQLPRKLDHGGCIEIKILKPETLRKDDDFLDTDSLTTVTVMKGGNSSYPGWYIKYRLDIEDVSIKKSSGTECVLVVKNKMLSQERDIEFCNEFDKDSFIDTLTSLRRTVGNKTLDGLNHFLEKIGRNGDEPCNLLVEIVGAMDLRVADVIGSSDPYVTVMMKDKVIHKTKVISKDLDPVWTVTNGSLFLITETIRDFYLSGGLTFIVSDSDKIGKDDALGQTFVRQEHLFSLNGERDEFDLYMPRQNRHPQKGRISIKAREASKHDIEFVRLIRLFGKRRGIAKQTDLIAPFPSSIRINRLLRKTRLDEITREKLRRVLPVPGPDHPEELEWMSEQTIEVECYKTSKTWIETGYGTRGKLYVEIIGCDNLPNLDSGGRNKTDAFVTVMYEDAIFSTDVVPDCLSPRFMPWTRRAFIFNIVDPTSQLFISAHDEDSGAINMHDPIGRVAVNLSNFFPNTSHILHYDLYKNSQSQDRKKRGTITIRLALEWENPKDRFFSVFSPSSKFHINVQEKKNFALVRYTIQGEKDLKQYSFETIKHYLDELNEACINSTVAVIAAFNDIVYWEDSHQFNIFGTMTIKCPLHSIVVFVSTLSAIEKPNLIPGLTLLGIAWIMLAFSKRHVSRPSPWARTLSYIDGFRMMRCGEFRPKKISPNENLDEDVAFMNQRIERLRECKERITKFFDETNNYNVEYERVMKGSSDLTDADDITTKKGSNISFLPLKDFFYPYQVTFRWLCHVVRYFEYIITWKHYFVAFWITTVCIVLGIIFLFIPWGFVFLWSFRIFTWWKLGPWWKLMEILFPRYVQKSKLRKKANCQVKDSKQRSVVENDLLEIRKQREEAIKLQSMKKLLYGQYTVSLSHVKKLEKFYCNLPLPHSSATPFPKGITMKSKVSNERVIFKRGQRIEGQMIPSNIDKIIDLEQTSTILTKASEVTGKTLEKVTFALAEGVIGASDLAYDIIHVADNFK